QFWKSTDGGKTFPKQLRPPHGDNHDLWIASNDPQRMIEANDGGGTVSVNGGETWTEEDYPTAQLYHIAIDNRKPYFVCGAQQDNSTVCMPSKGWGFLSANGRAPGDYFYAVGGGESGYIANSPAAPDIYYAGSYGGLLTAYDHSNGQERAVNPWPDNPMGYSSGDIAERFQWTFPIVVDPLDPKTVYAGSQHLMRSTNGGQSWETISPDLTRHDPKTLGASGGPITKDQTGVETYATIFSIAPSPVKAGVIWTGSDDGFVQVTQDGGKTWANVTPKDLPPFARIQMVEASPRQPGRAYVAASRYQSDDLGLYAYRTDDFGKTWTKITNGIRPGDFVRVVREDPGKEGLLYAGTEHGIYLSFDDGASWQPFGLNLPDAQVPDILTHEGDIVIATHGRSAYILDGGAAFLRQLAPVVAQHDVHLFKPTDATRSLDRNVAILYNLKQPAKELTVDILDAQGNVVRSFKHTPEKKDSTAAAGGDDDEGFRGPPQPKSPPNKAGLNRFTWDLRYPGPVTFPKLIMWAAGTNGPKAPVGTYQVRLTADGNAQTQSFAIGLDPRVEGVTPADIKAQFDFAVKIRDRASEANEAVIAIRDVKDQVADRLKKSSDAGVKKLADAFTGKISGIEQEIYQVRNQSNQDPLNFPIKLNNKIAALQGVVESADARPTDQSLTVFNQLSAKLQVQLDALKAAFETDLPRLNKALQGKGLDPVAPPSPEKIRTIADGARDQ
ncbi:MAG TPA: hypothetical protein VFQ38_09910, partial [Longimicrobiales bacterium]|nr:hypothetical protein [Longimicrobiales bacterium]